jgi:hypothetical protein
MPDRAAQAIPHSEAREGLAVNGHEAGNPLIAEDRNVGFQIAQVWTAKEEAVGFKRDHGWKCSRGLRSAPKRITRFEGWPQSCRFGIGADRHVSRFPAVAAHSSDRHPSCPAGFAVVNSKMLVVVSVMFVVGIALLGTAAQRCWNEVSQLVALAPLAP